MARILCLALTTKEFFKVTVSLDHFEGFDPGNDPDIADFGIVRAGEPYEDALKRLAALGCKTSIIGSIEVKNSGKPFRLTIRPTNRRNPRSRVEYVSVCRSMPAEAHVISPACQDRSLTLGRHISPDKRLLSIMSTHDRRLAVPRFSDAYQGRAHGHDYR